MPLLVGIGWLLLALLSPAQAATPCTTLEVFVREGCPHCARAEVWLTELGARRPGLDVRLHDIVADPAARERMLALSAARPESSDPVTRWTTRRTFTSTAGTSTVDGVT